MGIQINGQTDIISATDGSLTLQGAELPTVTNLNATGITTLGVTSTTNLTAQQLNVSGVGTVATLNITQSNPTNLNVSGVTTTTTLRATSIVGVTTAGITTAYITNLAGVGAGTSIQVSSGSKLVGLTTGSVYAPGTIIQVVSSTPSTVDTISNGNTYATLISQTITPTFSNSKILVNFSCYMSLYGNNTRLSGNTQLLRGSTVIWGPNAGPQNWVDAGSYHGNTHSGSFTYLDSPATTSTVTYNLQGKEDGDQWSTYASATLILMEVAQ